MEYLTVKEASKLLKLSETTVYRMLREGSIKARKIGKQWRILGEELFSTDKRKANSNVVEFVSSEMSSKGKGLRFIDLFCGIGGFRLAGDRFGMECVFSSDNDKFVQETYESWYGEKPAGDITEFTKSKSTLNRIPEFDVLFAGFPCQPFSYAGQNKGFEDTTRGTLFFHVAKIVKHHQPQAVILENVKGLKSHNKGNTIKTVKKTLDEMGYILIDEIINSYEFGVPQYRERWFCVALRKDLFKGEHSNFKLTTRASTDKSNLKDIIVDESNHDPKLKIPQFELERIKYHFENMHKFSNGRVEHDNSRYGKNTKKGRHGVFSFLKPDKTLRFHIGDRAKTQIQEAYYVHCDTYGPAIIANRRPKLWDLGRFLSVKECLRLQAFPDYLTFPVSDAQAYKQLGNSVCVTVVESVINDMLDFLSQAKKCRSRNFKKQAL